MFQARQTNGGLALPVLLLTFLLLVVQATSHSSRENVGETDIASLPPDADNVELHHVKVVDGVMHENHPVVMYKEDFVNEDYDPSKNETKVSQHKKYRHLQRTRHHHTRLPAEAVGQPEKKIIFDVLPATPIILNDDDSAVDKLVAAQLLQPSKAESPQKYPKKYHSRQRRQAYDPYAHPSYKNDYYSTQQVYYQKAPVRSYLPIRPQLQYQRYPTSGKKPKYRGKLPYWQSQKPDNMPTGLDNRIGDEDSGSSLFHNSNPDDADFSIFDQPRPDSNQISGGSGSNNNWQSPPLEEPDRAPVWGPSAGRRPNNGRQPATQAPIWSQTTTGRPMRPQQQIPRTESPPPQQAPTATKVSNCVWAIVNCCSQGSTRIRYNCFEEFGCHGAFWGVNPCAESVRDAALGSFLAPSASKWVPPNQVQASPASWATTPRPRPRPQLRPQSVLLEDAVQYPQEPSYQIGSACHRASRLCCRLRNLGSMYDCFQHHSCEQSISEMLSTCS